MKISVIEAFGFFSNYRDAALALSLALEDNSGTLTTQLLSGEDSVVGKVVLAQSLTHQNKRLQIAVGNSCYLTLSSKRLDEVGVDSESESDSDSESDETTLEFDNIIDALEWDPEGRCVIVGDASGTLHFVTKQGDVVFSHSIVPKGDTLSSDDPRIISISFVPQSSLPPALVVIFDNGDLFGISKLPVQSICGLARSQPQVLATAVQRLQFLRLSLPLCEDNGTVLKTAIKERSDSERPHIHILSLNDHNILLLTRIDLSLPSTMALEQSETTVLSSGVADFVFVPGTGCVSASLDDRALSLWDLATSSRLLETNSLLLEESLFPAKSTVLSILHVTEGLVCVAISSSSTSPPNMLVAIGHLQPRQPVPEPTQPNISTHFCLLLHSDDTIHRSGTAARTLMSTGSIGPLTHTLVDAVGGDGFMLLIAYAADLKSRLDCVCNGLSLAFGRGALVDLFAHAGLADRTGCTFAGYLLASGMTQQYDASYPNADSSVLHHAILAQLPLIKPVLLPMLPLLLAVPGPPTGFVGNVIEACNDADQADEWKMIYKTAVALVDCFIVRLEHNGCVDKRLSESAAEDRLRQAVLSLRPATILNTYFTLAKQGHLQEAAMIMVQLRPNRRFDPVRVLKAVPQLPLDQVVEWASTHLVPTTKRMLKPGAMCTSRSTGGYESAMYGIAGELCSRAIICERNHAGPSCSSLPLGAVSTASRMIHALGIGQGLPGLSVESSCNAVQRIDSFFLLLRLQSETCRRLGQYYPVSELQSLELAGVVSEYLWKVPEACLAEKITSTAKPLVEMFGGDMSSILAGWVGDAVADRVVLDKEVPSVNVKECSAECKSIDELMKLLAVSAADEDFGGDCSECNLSRLVLGAGLIEHSPRRAETVLLLLQTPAISGTEESDEYVEAEEEASDSREVHPVLTNSVCTTALTLMAAQLLEPEAVLLPPSLFDSLSAALRGQKIRSLAYKYGVAPGGFDPRSQRQVRLLVGLVSSRADMEESIADSLYIAEIWGTTGHGGLDVSSVLSRAIIARITDPTLVDGDSVLIRALRQVPLRNIPLVVEEVLACVLGGLEDLYRQSCSATIARLEDEKDRAYCKQLCRGATVVTTTYLDLCARQSSGTSLIPSMRTTGAIMLRDQSTSASTELIAQLKRLHLLQQLGLYLSLSALRCAKICQEIASTLAAQRADELLARIAECDKTIPLAQLVPTVINEAGGIITPIMRRGCNLLLVSPVFFSHSMFRALLTTPTTERILLAMAVARVIGQEGRGCSTMSAMAASEESELILDTAYQLCGLVGRTGTLDGILTTQMQIEPFSISRELLRIAAAYGSIESIGRVTDLIGGSELVLSVFLRTEDVEGSDRGLDEIHNTHSSTTTGSSAANSHPSAPAFKVSNSSFHRDGLLMSPATIIPPLLKYSIKEKNRRHFSANAIAATAAAPSDDVEELCKILQGFDSHMLAIRVLLHSWSRFPAKASLLRTSLVSLSRRILAYRDIDREYAIATLLSLPFEIMVRELKAAVPTIQSDFSRLLTVAVVGEELARLWDHDQLLQVFQGLQVNAKWWNTLTQYKIKTEPSSFQSENVKLREACIRGIVPMLLDANGMDLDEALEYCRQFDLEPELAVVSYVEKILLEDPAGPADATWSRKIQSASQRVEEAVLLALFRRVLNAVNGVDYEKIIFLARWLVNSDEEDEDALKDRVRAEETALYRHYIDVCSFLTALPVPSDAAHLANSCSAESTLSQYLKPNTAAAYTTRISLWALIGDPWCVLTTLFRHAPKESLKITPIIGQLGLDESDYSSRRILASHKPTAPGAFSSSAAGAGTESGIVNVLREQIQTIKCPITRIQTWQQLAAVEKLASPALAAACLREALIACGNRGVALDSKNAKQKLGYVSKTLLVDDPESLSSILEKLRADVTNELLGVYGEQSVASLRKCLDEALLRCAAQNNDDASFEFANTGASTGAKGVPHSEYYLQCLQSQATLMSPALLLARLLEVTAAVCWDIQLLALGRGIGGRSTCPTSLPAGITILDILHSSLVPSVCEVVQRAKEITLDLAAHWEELSPCQDHKDENRSSASLEGVRQALIGKLLSDVDQTHASGGSSAQAGPSRGLWAWPSTTGLLQPTTAERRRREDIHLSFNVAVLVASSPGYYESTTTAASTVTLPGKAAESTYISQLVAVALGKGVRAMRRLTGRSRLRASQALHFLHEFDLTKIESVGTATSTSTELSCTRAVVHRDFLYCLAGLQETRLACDDGTLYDAVTPSSAAGVDKALALVHTWIHDEGGLEEVAELCRDVLLFASSGRGTLASATQGTDSSCRSRQILQCWKQLLQHMELFALSRVYFQTLVMLKDTHSMGHGLAMLLAKDSAATSSIATMVGSLLVKLGKDIDDHKVSRAAARKSLVTTLVTSGKDSGHSASSFEDKENSTNLEVQWAFDDDSAFPGTQCSKTKTGGGTQPTTKKDIHLIPRCAHSSTAACDQEVLLCAAHGVVLLAVLMDSGELGADGYQSTRCTLESCAV